MARPLPRNHEIVHRSCPLCEAHCGVSIEVDRSEQRVVTVRGDEQDPRSRGYLCPKAYGLKGLHEDPDRLRRPLRRRGPRPATGPDDWEEISWEEAFDEVANGLAGIRDAHGANAVATYIGNPTAHDMASIVYGSTFQRALGTKWRFSASSVDQLPKMVSSAFLYGSPLAFPVPDIDRTDYLLVLGANPVVSNGSLCTAPDFKGRLEQLRARGGRLVVVDPRRSETAAIADEHLAIRPGSDAYFLFAIVNVLFEEERAQLGRLAPFTNGVEEIRTLAKDFPPEAVAPATGIPAETTRRIARELAANERAVCYGRIGTCTQAFGTLASWLVDVVNLLSGNVDTPGGAMWPRAASGPGTDPPRTPGPVPYARWHSHVRGLPEFNGELPVATLAEEIDAAGDERVRGFVTLAGNPVLSTPNGGRLARALEGLDFMASVDIYLNETTRYADVILPPTGHLEHSNYEMVFDQLSIRHWSKYSPQVLPKPEGTRHAWEILSELSARLAGVTPDAVEQVLVGALASSAVGRPGTACPEVSLADAKQALGEDPGPDRVLDLLLRAGPHGDHFDPESDGLSLERVRSAEHGLDLGPMEQRLPEMLATESGRIELAPRVLVEDVGRLRDQLASRSVGGGLVLIGRRHLRSNNSWMHNVDALAKGPERCTLLVHPQDAARLGLSDGGDARVRSRVGELVAPVTCSEDILPGVVSLPHGHGHGVPGVRLGVAATRPGVNSNLLTDEADVDVPSGNGVLSGIPVEVSPA